MQKPPAAPAATPAPLPRDLALFAQGNQAMRAGDLAGAEQLYKKALALNPRLSAAWANLGLLAANSRRYPEAAKSFAKALALEPQNTAYLMPLAQAQSQAGQLAAAEKTLEKARRIWPKEESVLAMLAQVQMTLEHFLPAAQTLKTLNALRKGKDKQTLGLLVTALLAARQRKEARVWARTLAARFPKEATGHLLVGDLSAQLRDWPEAQRAYGRAFALNPKAGKAALAAGACAEKAGDTEGAIALYQKLARRRPGEPVAHLAHGKTLLLQKEYERAQAQLEAAFVAQKNAGSEPEFLVPLGEALLFQGRQNDGRALEYLKAAVSIDPAHERARRSLAFLHLRAGHLADAVVQLRALRELDPDDDATTRQIAELLAALGKTDAACDEWRSLATRRRKDPEPLRQLALLLEKQNRPDEARRAVRAALARAPDDTATLLLSAGLEERAGDAAAALRVLERAVALAPTEEELNEALLAFLERRGARREAQAAAERWALAAPEQIAPLWALAANLLGRGLLDDARPTIEALKTRGAAGLNLARRRTETRPESASAWYLYAALLRHAGRPDEASRAFDEAVRKGFTQ